MPQLSTAFGCVKRRAIVIKITIWPTLRCSLQAAKAAGARRILITTDGVFSMDGTIAQLDVICDLAEKYDAMVHHDDCHATGFMGAQGRGVHEYCNVMDRVDITTGTFGKALGGGSGGLHGWASGDHRLAATAFTALLIFKHLNAINLRGVTHGFRYA